MTGPPDDGGAGASVATLVEGGRLPYDAGGVANVPRVAVAAEVVSSDVDVQGMMFAAGEMQISGEPFAQHFAGRNLGMWGLVMIDGMDNLDEWPLTSLSTSDGVTLGGFASTAQALKYDDTSPLRWFPVATIVGVDATAPYPPVTSLMLTDPTSRSVDLAALLLGNAMFFATTDGRNAGIGQSAGLSVVFDGDPFACGRGSRDRCPGKTPLAA